MKHLKKINNNNEYEAFIQSNEFMRPNITYVVDDNANKKNPQSIIITSESNPEVMEICYIQGWAASPEHMTLSEAENVTSIGTCFSGTSITHFEEFKYFTNVQTLERYAFNSCTKLEIIGLPSSITNIGYYCFYSNSSLRTIISHIEKTLSLNNVFSSVPSYGTIYYPQGTNYHSWNGLNYWFAREIGSELPNLTLDGYDMAVLIQPTSTSSTQICKATNSITEVSVNGTILDSVSTGYTFDTPYSWNVVRYKFADDTIPASGFSGTTRMYAAKISNTITTIGDRAFSNCSGLISINTSDSITSIGNSAFTSCSNLQNVYIGNNVATIGKYAFNSCSRLSSMFIPDSITSIETNAFGYCSNLTSIHIGTGVTNIATSAFTNCTQLKNVIIPETVQTIGQNAFYNCSSLPIFDGVKYAGDYLIGPTDKTLSTYKIKDHTKIIGSYAFSGCTNLDIITIPDSVVTISSYAFANCSGLTSIEIPDSVKYIQTSAFYNGKSLSDLSVGASCLEIGSSAFTACNILTSVTTTAAAAPVLKTSAFSNIPKWGTLNYPNGNDYSTWDNLTSGTFGSRFWNKPQPIVRCVFNVTSTNTATKISHTKNFEWIEIDGKRLTSINTGYTFTTTGEHVVTYGLNSISLSDSAFTSCTNLVSIDIPDSVTTIGARALYSCSGLTDVKIGSGVTTIGNYAFGYCSGLTEVNIGSEVSNIDAGAFYSCANLQTVNIPDSVITIGASAFENCKKLTTIEIPDSVISIGDEAFSACTKLNTVIVHGLIAPKIKTNTFANIASHGILLYPEGGNYSSWLNLTYWSKLEQAKEDEVLFTCKYKPTTITEATKLCNNTFNINYMTIDGVETTPITSYIFDSLDEHTVVYNLKGYGINKLMLSGATNVTGTLIIPETIKKIDASAFTNTYGFTAFELHSGIKEINNYCFYNCSGLTGNLDIPDSVTSIGSSAFYGCSGLTSLSLGLNLTSISSYAFYGCLGLSGELNIPNSVVSIGGSAFTQCYGFNNVTLGDSLNTIGDCAFSGCTGLTSALIIPDSVETIGKLGFGYCSGLTSLTIGSGVTSIGENAFYDCKNLTSITVSSDNTFYDSRENCNCLIETATNTLVKGAVDSSGSVIVPDTVEVILGNSFSYMKSLKKITIGLNVKTIYTCFYECNNLQEILSYAVIAPTINYNTFYNIRSGGVLYYPEGSDYSSWINYSGPSLGRPDKFSLGYYGWSTYQFTNNQIVVDCTYNVVDTTAPTKLCTTLIGINYMIIDGNVVDPTMDYMFNEVGEHSVQFNMFLSTLPHNMFKGVSLTTIVIPDSVHQLGNQMCSGCTSLSSVILPNTIAKIPNYAFSYCTNLTSFTFPDSIKTIGSSSFVGCRKLSSITFGANVTSIGNDAFSGCTSLTGTLIIPDSITSLGDYAFYSCTGIEKVIIGSGCTYVGSSFRDCSNLKTVEIGPNVTKIGHQIFAYCKQLNEIICHAKIAPSLVDVNNGLSSFLDIKSYGVLYYPEGSDYSSWMGTAQGFLGYYSWFTREIGVDLPELTLDGYDMVALIQPNSTASTQICKATSGITEISVNGTILDSVSTGYTFDTPYSWNVVKYKFSDNVITTSAFSGLSRVYSTNISGSITNIGTSAFTSSSINELIIGDTIISIASRSFCYCSSLKSITIGSGVTSIGDGAFQSCTSLSSITNGNGVISIGNSAFTYCTSLTSINIPDSVESIGNYAFETCSGLTEVIIGSGVTSIGNNAFGIPTHSSAIPYYYSKIKTIIVSPDNITYDSRDNCNCLIETASNKIIKGCNNSFIPNTIVTINGSAFAACTQLTALTIPNSVTSINGYAFNYCLNLEHITIKSDSIYINSTAFQKCDKLPVEDNVRYAGTYLIGVVNSTQSTYNIKNDTKWIGTNAFANCTNLSSIIIPDSVTSIGDYAFTYCIKLPSIIIPDSVTSIGDYAFNNCGSLTSITISSSISKIQNFTFKDCTSLPIENNIRYADTCLVEIIDKTLTTYNIKQGTKWIGYNALSNCFNLTSIDIPDSVTSIGDNAFSGCSGLTSITIPDSVTSIGDNAFSGCSGLTSIEIPGSVTEIGNSIFANCSGLTTIISYSKIAPKIEGVISSNARTYGTLYYPIGSDYSSWIGNSTWFAREYGRELPELTLDGYDMVALFQSRVSGATPICNWISDVTEISVNGTVLDSVSTGYTFDTPYSWNVVRYKFANKTVPRCVFYNIVNRAYSVQISDTITSITFEAFRECPSLTSIVMPNTITSIGSTAFQACVNLTSITLSSTLKTISTSAFVSCSGLTSITIPDSVTLIDKGAFNNCSNLASIVVSSGNTVYDSRENCNCIIETATNKLIQGCKNSFIPDSVTSIGDSAFQNCKGLTSIVIPDSITNVPWKCFSDCTNLTDITLPATITNISSSAFYTCEKLTSIEIPSSVTFIGTNAFSYCRKLKSITCYAQTAPTIENRTFYMFASNGILYFPEGADYSSWLNTSSYYLGYYNWTGEDKLFYTPTTYYGLTITADAVNGRKTKTTIHWTCMSDGYSPVDGTPMTGIQLTGTSVSAEFPQNTSETDTIERTITFEYQGLTASTTITQGVWVNQSYTVDLNNQWQLSADIANPDSSVYDGVYQSFSNKGVNNSAALMYIDIVGYTDFSFYVRNYGPDSNDFVVVSNLDTILSGYNSTGTTVAHQIISKQNSNTTINDYQLVEFTGIDGGEHRITVMYRKGPFSDSGTDRGYVLIPKEQ